MLYHMFLQHERVRLDLELMHRLRNVLEKEGQALMAVGGDSSNFASQASTELGPAQGVQVVLSTQEQLWNQVPKLDL